MKKITYLAVGLALLLIVIYAAGKIIANSKLNQLIESSNEEGNLLSVGERSLSFNLLNFGLELDSVRLDQRVGPRRVSGSIGSVSLSGLSLLKAIGGSIDIDDLLLEGADLDIHPAQMREDSTKDDREDKKKITLHELRLVNSRVLSYDEEGTLKAKIDGLNISGALQLPLAPATAPKMQLSASKVLFPATDDTDQIIDSLEINVEKRTVEIGDFRIAPKMATRAFLTSIEYKRAWQALHLKDVKASDVPFDSLLAGGRSVFPEITIGDLSFAIYENPSLERSPNEPYKKFPIEKFRQLGEEIWLQSLTVEQANIAYGVHKEGAERPDITFSGSIKAGNFSTWKQNKPAFMEIDCLFEKTSPLKVRFELDQRGDGRDFTTTGTLRDYDLPKINPLMIVAANADIEKGYITELNHNFSIENGVAKGDLLLRYNNLEVKMTGKNAWFINLIEDLAIRDSNPRNDGDLVVGTVHAEHIPTKSFFNIYWKSLVSGMKSSVAGKVFIPEEITPE
ncbi:hypothetical protein FUA23_17820 [Neolewinella aurantiaca]|uniref:DUF748 domain-containing protein n=1 Tax=Neolewinella aurantiaca TaxID=2602767 RepID=A0A5C7FNS4_9BACT|nr:hypothetical protein [Neolewinella aurantiaca]TXF87669.1 hypothetical protein FUA23_17820 [Neolewinella aurantiaca]